LWYLSQLLPFPCRKIEISTLIIFRSAKFNCWIKPVLRDKPDILQPFHEVLAAFPGSFGLKVLRIYLVSDELSQTDTTASAGFQP
jgi:hypothetical protein